MSLLSDEIDSVPEGVGLLALKLHYQRNKVLEIEDNSIVDLRNDFGESPMWTIQGARLIFSSLAARNQCAAVQFYRENIGTSSLISKTEAFEFALTLWRYEIGHEDCASGRFASLLAEQINWLNAAAELINSDSKEAFQVLHVVETILPYLSEITVEDLCALTIAQHPKTEGALAQGTLFNVIESVLVGRPELAWKVYRYLASSITTSTMSLAASALLALTKAGESKNVLIRVIADSDSKNNTLIQLSLWVIGRLMNGYELPANWKDKCLKALRKGLLHASTDLRRVASHSIELGARRYPELRVDLLNLGQSHDQDSLFFVVQHLRANSDEICQDGQLSDFLDVIIHVSPELGQCVRSIDWVVSQLLTKSMNTDLLLDFLRKWVILHGDQKLRERETIEQFEQTIVAISERPEILQRLITEWLIADEPQITSACHGLISFLWVRGIRNLSFSREKLDEMDHPSIIHLARRMLGYVYSEEPLLSLTFSLLESRDASIRTYPIVHELLTRDVGRNFVEATLQAIDLRIPATLPPLQALFESAKNSLIAYQQALDALPVLQELRGPHQLRRAIAIRKAADAQKTMESAHEKSVFLQLVTRIPVKAGIGSFTVHDGEIGETNRFGSISHSVTLPRRSISDPVGYAIDGLHYRLSKRGDE